MEIFKLGNRVVWREQEENRKKELLQTFKMDYGEGPFTIVGVRDVTDEAREQHPQVICMDGITGKDGPLPFSGTWFTLHKVLH